MLKDGDIFATLGGRGAVQLLLRVPQVAELHAHPARWGGAVHGGDRALPPRRHHDCQVNWAQVSCTNCSSSFQNRWEEMVD